MSAALAVEKINLVRIAHVYYKHKDTRKVQEFLCDFGFLEVKRVNDKVYYRGYSSEPFIYCLEQSDKDEFGGAAFVVESEQDLERATQTLPGATEIYTLDDAPGGGRCMTFRDPVDNCPFHLVYGQHPAPDQKTFPEPKFNYPTDKQRPANQSQRFKKGPALVHRLGHFGLCVTDFPKMYEFYTTHFNFIPSELVHDESGTDITTFLRLDRGTELVDHHCFFFFPGPKFHVHHSSFETHDFDTQVLGHDWLRHQGFDPSRFILEHYVDGDLVDSSQPVNRQPASPDNLHVWGPDLPPTFLQ
ncbi:MAG: hypothetical protein M1834_005837 [Cirrosporium novae-zelandiae]|nr:MAG: hypothetical protein M1834_005837 [Cirrosporium novae-zelandiae]